MWGPRGQVLTKELDRLDGRHRGSQRNYLPDAVFAPVLAHLEARGVTPSLAAQLVGEKAGDPVGGMKQVLGSPRMRRDRLSRLAEGLEDPFLHEILAEQIWYDNLVEVLPARQARTFDVEVEDLHNLVAEDMVVHNCAPPFKQAEFDILYGVGVSREGSLIDLGVEHGIVRKSGAWYTYDGTQLGQGKENARKFLRENVDMANEVEKKIKEKLGVPSKDDGAPGSDSEASAKTDPVKEAVAKAPAKKAPAKTTTTKVPGTDA